MLGTDRRRKQKEKKNLLLNNLQAHEGNPSLHCSKCYDSDSAKYGMLEGHQIWAFNPE